MCHVDSILTIFTQVWIYINSTMYLAKDVKQGQNGHIPLFGKICMDLQLFVKYLVIYHIFEIQVCCVTQVLETWVLWKNSLLICRAIFYGTRVHKKLEFPISGRSLHISETVVDCKIFPKIVVFDHFSLPNKQEIGTKKPRNEKGTQLHMHD